MIHQHHQEISANQILTQVHQNIKKERKRRGGEWNYFRHIQRRTAGFYYNRGSRRRKVEDDAEKGVLSQAQTVNHVLEAQ